MKRSLRLSFLLLSVLAARPMFSQPASPPVDPRFDLPARDDLMPGAGPVRRADWFRKLWSERRALFNQHMQQDQGAVVFLGDSITQGWNENFHGLFPGLKLANRGIGGDTTRGVLFRMTDDVLALHPGAVVLLIGTNDLEDQADPEVIVSNLKLILAKFKEFNPNMPIILCQVFPSSATKKRPADQIKKLNQLFAAAVKGNTQVTLVETWTLFANAQGDAKPEEFPDLLHPNDAGYRKLAAGLRPLLATLGLMDTEMDSFTPEPGFVSLFNGHDLTGWGFQPTPETEAQAITRRMNTDSNAPASPIITRALQFDGQTASNDGRYVAKNGRLIVTTPTEGRRLQKLWTTREFPKDFILKLEFRATPNADSGVYIRQPQLQCRDYLLAGPYKQLKQYRQQDWNEMIVSVTNGVAYCTCNGEVLEAALKVPPTGPIGLEGDRGQMEYRRLRVQELP